MSACQSCGTGNPETARFCIGCGSRLGAACASCGSGLPSGSRFCPSCGRPVQEEAAPSEMLKVVTILFADVVDSTARAEKTHPEDIRALLSNFFTTMAHELEAQGGTIDSYAGDGLMALFGVPTAREDDPLRAVHAAKAMLTALRTMNSALDDASKLAIRIGINTGEVSSAGSLGRDLLVTGDAVNVAFRIQEAAPPGTVTVGERTGRAVGASYELEPVEMQLRGKSEPVRAFFVGRRKELDGREMSLGLSAPVVGRDGELELIESMFERVARESKPHLVTIVGEAGLGKSRLVKEFLARAEHRPGTRVVMGRCLPHAEGGVTLWPLHGILRTEAGMLATDPPDVALSKIRKLVREFVPDAFAPDPNKTTAALAWTIGLAPEGGPLAGADPRDVYLEVLAAWRALLTSFSLFSPLVVVIEDLHWADPTMLDVLSHLAVHVEGGALFLCPTRPGALGGDGRFGEGLRNHASITLDPLTPEQGVELVSFFLDEEGLPQQLRASILAKSEGNPFFLEEIVKALVDEGHLTRDGERWRTATSIVDFEVPDRIQDVILSRIDLLPPVEKHVLQQAAVVGRTFWSGAVEALTGMDDVADTMAGLQRRDLVVQKLSSALGGEVEYAFKHVLTRDVAWETLPRRSRGAAHAAAAEWLELKTGGSGEEHEELLAYHYEQAAVFLDDSSLRRKARIHCLIASEVARRRMAIEQAERLARRAVDLSIESGEKAEALEKSGDIYHFCHNGDQAWRMYIEALEEASPPTKGGNGSVARLAAKSAILSTRWEGTLETPVSPVEVERVISTGLEAAGENDSRERALLLSSKAFLQGQGYQARDEGGRLAAEESLRIAERLDDPDLMSAALDASAFWLLPDARYGPINEVELRRLELVPRLADLREISDVYASAAWSSTFVGHYPKAVAYVTEAIERSRGVDAGQYLYALSWRVLVRFLAGDWSNAMQDFDEVLSSESRDGAGLPVPYAAAAYGAAAYCKTLQGRADEAGDYIDMLDRYRRQQDAAGVPIGITRMIMARALAHGGRTEEASTWLHLERGAYYVSNLEGACEVVAAGGVWDRAASLARTAREEAVRGEVEALHYYVDRLEGRHAEAHEDLGAAVQLLQSSADGFDRLGARWETAWSRLHLGRVLWRAGDASARGVLERALETFLDVNSAREIEDVRTLLG